MILLRARWRAATAALMALAPLLVGALLGGPASASLTVACGAWAISPSVAHGASDPTSLTGIAASSTTDAWAVGSWFNGSKYRTFAERWNGTTWSAVATPNVNRRTNSLRAVAALSSTDAWAVGSYDDHVGFGTLIEHWNGTKWKIVPSPNAPGATESVLWSVTAVSASDIWAVGFQKDGTTGIRTTLTEHWNGSAWSVVPSPNVGTDENFLWSVVAVSSTDVWAVGAWSAPWFQTLVEHWDGANWTVIQSGNRGNGSNVLYGVTTAGPAFVRAVGNRIHGPGNDNLTGRWTGTSFTVFDAPNGGTFFNVLWAVAAAAHTDVWAVGSANDGQGQARRTQAIHYNGTNWQTAPTPATLGGDADLFAVARVPGTHTFWATGSYYDSGDHQVIETYC